MTARHKSGSSTPMTEGQRDTGFHSGSLLLRPTARDLPGWPDRTTVEDGTAHAAWSAGDGGSGDQAGPKGPGPKGSSTTGSCSANEPPANTSSGITGVGATSSSGRVQAA
jgi:hypothetical protein